MGKQVADLPRIQVHKVQEDKLGNVGEGKKGEEAGHEDKPRIWFLWGDRISLAYIRVHPLLGQIWAQEEGNFSALGESHCVERSVPHLLLEAWLFVGTKQNL